MAQSRSYSPTASNPYEKNNRCNGYYVGVVTALKWWRIQNNPRDEQPKSYMLERLLYEACPDNITSVAQGVADSLEIIAERYPTKPSFPDHGATLGDIFERVSDREYARFHALVVKAAKLAKEAFETDERNPSVALWRDLLGERFPKPRKVEKERRQ